MYAQETILIPCSTFVPMTISMKNRKAEIYDAYVTLLEEYTLLQSELVDAHKTVYPMPIENYGHDFKARYQITSKELKFLVEDLKKFFNFVRENSIKVVNKEITLPPILKN